MAFPTTEQIPGVPISLGKSINVPVNSLRQLSPVRRHGRSTSESGTYLAGPTKSRLPPAVATVPPDHIRGYVHNKRVNHYLVGNTLGEGSFAKVKEAFHIQVGEKVAMKVIDKKKAQQDPYVAKNFRREAKLLQMVRHPNILHLMEVIETDTSFYLITELCSGGELMKHIYSKGRLDETETRKYMRQIISAVDHLHRAGIIHRDLKVENMLLDGNMDIRIIDFGLSNEEYIQGENGMIHCSTQCGSPAYAAPELLGHKEYGPEVDIWSIGVNMYAMLTGCLPYTVEPFNITALHAKMLENKMNPIPDNLSTNCKTLLRRLLEANPENRIKMGDIMTHPWINEGHTLLFGPAPFPNHLTMKDVNMDIVDHMVHMLKVEQSMDDLIQELISNRATASACAYFLLSARLDRYQKRYPAKKTRTRFKSKLSSEFDEPAGDDDDIKSTKSVPSSRLARPGHGKHVRATGVQLRDKKGKDSSADRPISHPPFEESEPPSAVMHSHNRRKSMPPAILEEEVRRYNDFKKPPPTRGNTWGHIPRARKATAPGFSIESIEDNDQPYDTDYLSHSHNDPLGPVFQPNKGMSRNYSHGHALNKLREDLKEKLHPPQAHSAWRSNPGSRNPSRHGSRIPSSSSTRQSSIQSGLEELQDEEKLIFHPAKVQTLVVDKETKTLPRNFRMQKHFTLSSPTESDDTRLPLLHTSQPPPPTRGSGRHSTTDYTSHRRNGFKSSQTENYEVHTDRSLDEILTEMLRVAGNLKMRENELTGSTMLCYWKGVRFNLNVHKDKYSDRCQIQFKLLSGSDVSTYKDLCEKFIKKLKLV